MSTLLEDILHTTLPEVKQAQLLVKCITCSQYSWHMNLTISTWVVTNQRIIDCLFNFKNNF